MFNCEERELIGLRELITAGTDYLRGGNGKAVAYDATAKSDVPAINRFPLLVGSRC
jgi:hypothetical protein